MEYKRMGMIENMEAFAVKTALGYLDKDPEIERTGKDNAKNLDKYPGIAYTYNH